MDKFIVAKRIGNSNLFIAESFNNVTDAVSYCNVMRRKANGWEYSVYQLNEEL